MSIEQLEYLAAVTQRGSLRRASERLHISQPALSEAVRSQAGLGRRAVDCLREQPAAACAELVVHSSRSVADLL